MSHAIDGYIDHAKEKQAEEILKQARIRPAGAFDRFGSRLLLVDEVDTITDVDLGPANRSAARPAAEVAERYCIGLLVTETGEALQDLGNALRFGLDTPHSPDLPETARDHLLHELGDVMAATEFACLHGLFDRAGIEAARDRKLAKLCDPANVDHLGRPLAPQPIALGGAVLPCRIDGWTRQDGKLGLQLTDNGALYGFELDEAVAEYLLQACLAVFPRLAKALSPTAPPRTRLMTGAQQESLATFVFERDGQPFDLQLDWEEARNLRNSIDACFPNTSD